ncbi:Calcipressin-domain-containing protein, partial [Piptocephalis cylindrospora]
TPSPPLDPVSVEDLPPISPQATNTLLLTDMDTALFTPVLLDSVREVMEELGKLHSFSPMPAFGRIVIVYPTALEAALAHHQLKANAIDQDLGCSLYFGGNTPIAAPTALRYPNLLTVPEAEQLWLISPPGSPPVGWQSRPDDPPNMQPHADDIVAALHARFMDDGSQNMSSPSPQHPLPP